MLKEGMEDWTWAKSQSKERLEDLLWSGEIPLRKEMMKPKDAFLYDPLFALETVYKRFPARLRALRANIVASKKEVKSDVEGLDRDRQVFPMTTHDTEGRPHWQGSQADLAMKAFIRSTFEMCTTEDGGQVLVHNPSQMKKPKELYNSNIAYKAFSYNVFKKHISQEVKTIKFYNYRNTSSKKKTSKNNNNNN